MDMIWPEGVFMDKPHYGNHNFSPLTIRVYFILIIERTKMEVADTFVPRAF